MGKDLKSSEKRLGLNGLKTAALSVQKREDRAKASRHALPTASARGSALGAAAHLQVAHFVFFDAWG